MISDFLKGLVIGMGAIAPGISGGTIAVILGVYEKITDAIANIIDILKHFRKKVWDYLPLGLGGIAGVLGFSRIINFLFDHYGLEVKYLFIGLMAGTFPSLQKQAARHGFRCRYLIPFALALAATVVFSILDNSGVNAAAGSRPGTLLLMLYGAIIGFGTIIPGISASFILMYLGAYQALMEGVSNLDVFILLPVGIGFILSIVGFAKLISLLFRKAYGYTYYAVFGFTIGSVLSIFPGIGLSWTYLLCMLLLVLGFVSSYLLSKMEKIK